MIDKDKAKWLSEFYQQVADGGEPQFNYEDGWLAASRRGPDMNSNPKYWRVVMPPVFESLQAEIKRLNARLNIIQDSFQLDEKGDGFMLWSPDVMRALQGEQGE